MVEKHDKKHIADNYNRRHVVCLAVREDGSRALEKAGRYIAAGEVSELLHIAL
jgi:hypothetical protein